MGEYRVGDTVWIPITYDGELTFPNTMEDEAKVKLIGKPKGAAGSFLASFPKRLKGWKFEKSNLIYIDDQIYNIEQYVGTNVYYVENQYILRLAERIVGLHYHSGMWCVQCGDYAPYAEGNREDGSFICYCCRADPYRKAY